MKDELFSYLYKRGKWVNFAITCKIYKVLL